MKVDKSTYAKRMEYFHEVCRQEGVRITPQRLAVYKELARSADHPSADYIHKRVRTQLPTMTLDTVYRTLGKLEAMGLAIQVSLVASRMRFEANTDHHHHFVCQVCGSVLDVYSKKLDRLQRDVEVPGGHQADWIQVELRGTCQKCLARGRRSNRGNR
jgi:Fur family peroxide stress response transcriptional regulator